MLYITAFILGIKQDLNLNASANTARRQVYHHNNNVDSSTNNNMNTKVKINVVKHGGSS